MVDSVDGDARNDHHSGRLAQGRCTLEIWVDGRWQTAGEVRCADDRAGFGSPATFEYDFDYLDAAGAHLEATNHRAVSCRYPVGYQAHAEERWPAFLLDVIPSGAARRAWERELRLPNNASSDWAVLARGGTNPPGNVRVAPTEPEPPPHPGFARDEVLERAEGFLEYARRSGASIAGGSGAGGDAPKFLLREDVDGRFHADGALVDERTARCWIVKFSRSMHARDRLVLEAEAPYLELARRLGLRVGAALSWDRDGLFIPRFDRVVARGPRVRGGEVTPILRCGLESLSSLAGVSDFGMSTPKETLARALAKAVDDPAAELLELLRRDVVDVALGNTDNHARNTAVLKDPRAGVALAPVYDLAPMVLDPQGIVRVCRWTAEDDGYPRWSEVVDVLTPLGLDGAAARAWLRETAATVGELPRTMRDVGVPDEVRLALANRTARVARALEAVR